MKGVLFQALNDDMVEEGMILHACTGSAHVTYAFRSESHEWAVFSVTSCDGSCKKEVDLPPVVTKTVSDFCDNLKQKKIPAPTVPARVS